MVVFFRRSYCRRRNDVELVQAFPLVLEPLIELRRDGLFLLFKFGTLISQILKLDDEWLDGWLHRTCPVK